MTVYSPAKHEEFPSASSLPYNYCNNVEATEDIPYQHVENEHKDQIKHPRSENAVKPPKLTISLLKTNARSYRGECRWICDSITSFTPRIREKDLQNKANAQSSPIYEELKRNLNMQMNSRPKHQAKYPINLIFLDGLVKQLRLKPRNRLLALSKRNVRVALFKPN